MNNPISDKSKARQKNEPLRFLSPIHKAGRQISIYLETFHADAGIANPEAHLIAYLGSYSPCPIGELIQVFGHRKSTLTSILDRLEAKGLVTRSVNPADRRSFTVGLTDAGKESAEHVRGVTERFEKEVDQRITLDDRRGFQRVMDAIGRVTDVTLRNPKEK